MVVLVGRRIISLVMLVRYLHGTPITLPTLAWFAILVNSVQSHKTILRLASFMENDLPPRG